MLPAPIERWVKARLGGEGVPEAFHAETARGRLSALLSDRLEFHYSVVTLREEWKTPAKHHFEPLGLTSRESDVLCWVVEGKSNEEIGVILGLSTLTVKTHLQNIFKKMHVENRTTAAARAIELMKR